MVTTVLGHGEIPCVEEDPPSDGKGNETERIRILPAHALWPKSGSVPILSLWKPEKTDDGPRLNFLIF